MSIKFSFKWSHEGSHILFEFRPGTARVSRRAVGITIHKPFVQTAQTILAEGKTAPMKIWSENELYKPTVIALNSQIIAHKSWCFTKR